MCVTDVGMCVTDVGMCVTDVGMCGFGVGGKPEYLKETRLSHLIAISYTDGQYKTRGATVVRGERVTISPVKPTLLLQKPSFTNCLVINFISDSLQL